jgi:hypothetical protein
MKEHNGPRSGMSDVIAEVGEKIAKSDRKKPTKTRRVGGATQFEDDEGNFLGAMRTEDFENLKEDLKK